MKHNKEFADFLRDHVNLNETRLDDLAMHVESLTEYLENNHPEYVRYELHGSMATETMIRPSVEDASVDADVLVKMKYSKDAKVSDYVDGLYSTLAGSARYKDKLTKRNKAVTVTYSEESKCEVDLVPFVEINGKYYVCPRNSKEYLRTDGTGYRNWFNDKNRLTKGNLKKVVRLIKYTRDHLKGIDASSIVITTLAGYAVTKNEEGKESVRTVADTLVTVLERMSRRLDNMDYTDTLKNPALPTEEFSPGWSRKQFMDFRSAIDKAATDAREALDEPDRKKSIAKWKKLFGDRPFGGGQDGNDNDGGDDNPPSGPRRNISRGSTYGTSIGVSAPFRPRPNYATSADSYAPNANREYDLTMLTRDNIRWLRGHQPNMTIDSQKGFIAGRMRVNAVWDPISGLLTPDYLEKYAPPGTTLIRDEFEMLIHLRYRSRPISIGRNREMHNRMPPVFEIGGRARRLSAERRIQPADLHINTNDECCLTIDLTAPSRETFDLLRLIGQDITAWLYRLAYVERYGLQRAQTNLWREYDHIRGPNQHLDYLKRVAKLVTDSDATCPCRSGIPYPQCHGPQIMVAKSERLI